MWTTTYLNCCKFLFVFTLLIGIILIWVGNSVFYQPNATILSNIYSATEQVFMPPINATTICDNDPCEYITYSLGIIVNNITAISRTISEYCPIHNLPCEIALYDTVVNAPQIIYYNINDPQDTITFDNSVIITAQNNQSIAYPMFVFGGLALIIFLMASYNLFINYRKHQNEEIIQLPTINKKVTTSINNHPKNPFEEDITLDESEEGNDENDESSKV